MTKHGDLLKNKFIRTIGSNSEDIQNLRSKTQGELKNQNMYFS